MMKNKHHYITDATSSLTCCHVNAHENATCQPWNCTRVDLVIIHVSTCPSYTCPLERWLNQFSDGGKIIMFVTISVTKLWCNSVHHLCSVITVAHWRFGVFRHRYYYKHDDFAPVTELFQPAFQRTRVWWRGRHVYDDKVDTCMAGRLTRVQLHGWHVVFSSAFTWQHEVDEVAARKRWHGICYIMTFVFCHKNLTNLI